MAETKPPQTILVIDDDPSICKMAKSRLEWAGYQVTTTTTGDEGLSWAKQHHPDVILLDIRMPQMSGGEVLR